LNDKIVEAYSAISHLELHAAKWHYIKAWQALPSYGISHFAVRINNSRQKREILGIASSRLLRVSAEGEVLRTWRFSAMKCWSVNWESRQLAVAFDGEEVVCACLAAEPKVLHEFIGGYVFLALEDRAADERGAGGDEALFMKLTERR
jgi:hypothetical protein